MARRCVASLALSLAAAGLLAAGFGGRRGDAAAGGGPAHGVQGEPARDRRSEAPARAGASSRTGGESSSRPTRSGWRAASAGWSRRASGCGTPERWRRTSRSNARTTARRWSRGGGTTGRCGCGTGAGTSRRGARRRGGRWGFSPSDWKASWIEPGLPEDVTKSGPAPMLRREFKLSGAVERARAYVTSHGLYEMYTERPPRGG